MDLRAVVLGARGRIGRAAVDAILSIQRDAEICLVGRRDQPLKDIVEEENILFPTIVSNFDVTDPSSDWRRVWSFEPEVVINAVGPTIGRDPLSPSALESLLRYNESTLMTPLLRSMGYFERRTYGLYIAASGSISGINAFPEQIAYSTAHAMHIKAVQLFQQRWTMEHFPIHLVLFLNGVIEGTESEIRDLLGVRLSGFAVSQELLRMLFQSFIASPSHGQVILPGDYTFKPLDGS